MTEHLPIYSLHNFSSLERKSQQFQVEVFDANRHFSVKYPHRHDFFEVLFLRKGSGFHVIDGNKYAIQPPCIFFLSPGQAHKIEFSNDIEGYIYIFTADFYLINRGNPNSLIEFPFFFTIHQDNPPLLLEKNNDVSFIEQLFIQAVTELENKGNEAIEILRSSLDLLLTICASRYKIDDAFEEKEKGHILVKRFYYLVEENKCRNLSLNDYATLLQISPNHLTHTLKKLTGKTSTQIIKSKQILEIKRMLVHTNLTVSEIAAHLNFLDQSYFSKFFKRETGYTPLEYRFLYPR